MGGAAESQAVAVPSATVPRPLRIARTLSLALLGVIAIALLTPWMDRWGATGAEINAAFPGDELLPEPDELPERLDAVLQVSYLVFNEGYSASSGATYSANPAPMFRLP